MYPKLFEIGNVSINSYGLMISLGFLVCGLMLGKEFHRVGIKKEFAGSILTAALLGGYFGSKLYYLLENSLLFDENFLINLLSPSGHVWHGGFIGGLIGISIVIFVKKLSYFKVTDLGMPFLLLGHAFGRAGCFLAGDGCYGPPSNLPWSMRFPKGVVSTINNPKLEHLYAQIFPNQPIPPDIAVHPTPLYDIILLLFFFVIMWLIRKKNFKPGIMFSLFFVFEGLERFITEFWRTNPNYIFNYLSDAQLISIIFIIIGVVLIIFINKKYTYNKWPLFFRYK